VEIYWYSVLATERNLDQVHSLACFNRVPTAAPFLMVGLSAAPLVGIPAYFNAYNDPSFVGSSNLLQPFAMGVVRPTACLEPLTFAHLLPIQARSHKLLLEIVNLSETKKNNWCTNY
jgi:hypothetical protein